MKSGKRRAVLVFISPKSKCNTMSELMTAIYEEECILVALDVR
jgi:hypothetical protein